MFREYIELVKLSRSISKLDRDVQGKIIESGKKIAKQVGLNKTVVKMDGKTYLVYQPDYSSMRLVEVDVVEE